MHEQCARADRDHSIYLHVEHTQLAMAIHSFPEAQRRLEHEQRPGDDSGFRRSRRPMFGTHLVLLALQKPGHKNIYSLVRPNTGEYV